jgi:hypothetical protein
MASAAATLYTMDLPPEIAPREPPWSLESEQSLLGCLLQENGVMAQVSDLVQPLSFFHASHKLIFGAIAALLAARQPADIVTVFQALQADGLDDEAGGLSYINQLQVSVASTRNARAYAEIVAERAAERALIAGIDEAQRIAWDMGATLDARMERVNGVLMRVEQQRKSPAAHRVPLLQLSALREQAAAVRWLVKHVVPADSIGMLFGGSGTFKSFIALDLALHTVHGLPWLGRKTVQGPVIYIAAEGGSGVWSRIHAWHKARNLNWTTAKGDVPLYVVPAAIDLTVDAWKVVDAAQMVGVAPALVVVDTLSQTYAGEENSANEMAAYLRELGARFRQLWACSVMLIHHSGHQATERPRGSSAIRANVDYLLGVCRDEKEMLATVNCVKQKDGELFPDATFSMTVAQLGHDDDGDPVTSLVAWHLSGADEIARAQQAEQSAGRGGRQQILIGLVQNGMEEKQLRRAFYEELPGETDSDTRKKAYYRARDAAIRQQLMEVVEGIVIDLRKAAR